MIHLIRTGSAHADFQTLVQALDADLAHRDGADNAFYSQFNKITNLKQVVVAYDDETAVACGAFKEVAPATVEIKRMYTLPAHRGKGLAAGVLRELERWAAELGYKRCMLETGLRQPEAIRLYEKEGYARMANYGPYSGVANSVCFEKKL